MKMEIGFTGETQQSVEIMDVSMWSAWRQRTKSRLYCRGLCLTGPSKEQTPAVFVNILILSSLIAQGLNIYLFIESELLMLFCAAQLFGVLTIFFAWRTQFRDPGVLDPYLSYSNLNTQMLFNSFTSDDVQTINDDEVFQRADIYNPRYCDTCQIQRPPKSSHCRLCNNCVRGFDHHCTFLNNCIGRRNYRSFVVFLIVSVIYTLLLIAQGAVMITQNYIETGINTSFYFIVGSFLVFLICVWLTIKPTFKNSIRVALFMTGIAQAAISIFAFQYPRYILFNALLFGSFIYLLAIKDMFVKYINLVSMNLTFKEKMSRYEACMTYNMKDKFKEHVPCGLRTKNMFRFLFRKGNYKSAIEYK